MSRYQITFHATNDTIALDANNEAVVLDITNKETVVYGVYGIGEDFENVGDVKESPGLVLKDPFINRDVFKIQTANIDIADWYIELLSLKTVMSKKNKFLEVNTFPYIPHAALKAIPVVITDKSEETVPPNKFLVFSLQKSYPNT